MSPKSRTQKRNIISSKQGFVILRNWKTFKTLLWFIWSPLGGPDVRVLNADERKKVLVLAFEGGGTESFDLCGAVFREIPPAEVPFEDRDNFVRFLLLRLADKRERLLCEYSAKAGKEPKM